MSYQYIRHLFKTVMPWTFLLFMGTAWGLSFSLGKIAVENGAKPFGISQFQAMFAGIILLIVTLSRGRPIRDLTGKFCFIFIVAMLGAAVPSVLFYSAAPHVSAGVLSLTVALIPMMTYGFSLPLKLESFSVRRCIGLTFGVIAICLIVLPQNSLPDRSALPWIYLACLSSLCYASENIVLSFKSATSLGPIRLAMGMNLIAAIILLPITLITESFFVPNFPLQTVDFAVIGLGLITAVAYTMFVMSVSLFGSVFSSQVGYLVTLTGVFWGILIFDESHSLWIWLSIATLLCGLVLVTPKNNTSH
jgi:drug/metabolite transporter (DMT)-like permease